MSKEKPDKEAFFKALMAALLAFMIWSLLTQRLQPPASDEQSPAPRVTTSPATPSAELPAGFEVQQAQSEEHIDLGNLDRAAESAYRTDLELTNRGAAIASAWLTDYSETVAGKKRYQILAPCEGPQNQAYNSFTTSSVTINRDPQNLGADHRDEISLWNRVWNSQVERTDDGQVATFWVDIAYEDQPVLRVTKTYAVKPHEISDAHKPPTLTVTLENLSDAPIQVNANHLGPIGVPKEDPRSDNRKVSAGLLSDGHIKVDQTPIGKLKPKSPTYPLYDGQDPDLVWLALGNKFFAVILGPQGDQSLSWVRSASALKLTADDDITNDSTFKWVTNELDLQPAQKVSQVYQCYLGPKSKHLFKTVDVYVQRNYVALINLDYYWCAFTPIVNVMLWLLHVCHDYLPFHNYGVAIIIMVLIVRTLLHPLTKKGQVNMTRMAQQMAVLQPKMEEIRSKYGNDKQRLNQEMMKLYQERNINPAAQMLTCLPMMCQMPIWGALWAALNFTVELRHQPFILWIRDLTAPDALYTFSHPVFLLGNTLNLLPPLLGVGMWLQQRLMPKPAAAMRQATKTADQLTQQRLMMTLMSVLMVVIFYKAPSGLTLYIMASNFFGVFEQHRIRKHLKEEEERGGQGPTVPGGKPKGPHKPKFWARLEKMAEEAQKKR